MQITKTITIFEIARNIHLYFKIFLKIILRFDNNSHTFYTEKKLLHFYNMLVFS